MSKQDVWWWIEDHIGAKSFIKLHSYWSTKVKPFVIQIHDESRKKILGALKANVSQEKFSLMPCLRTFSNVLF